MPLQSLFQASDSLEMKAHVVEKVACDLAEEVSELKLKNVQTEEELDTVVREKDELNECIESVETKIDEQKKNLKRTINREAYWREKCKKLDYSLNETIYTQDNVDALNEKILQLQNENIANNIEIDHLNNRINELEITNNEIENAEIDVHDARSRTYSTKLQECVYSLLHNSVSYEKVCTVIQSVLNLVNEVPNKLPSVGTIHNWSTECVLLSRKQISEHCETPNTTIHTNEASKYCQKWGAFATRDTDGQYMLLGLMDMAIKSALDTLDTFKTISSDTDEVSEADGCGKKILVNIKNTTSD